jgi:hypothetical protein
MVDGPALDRAVFIFDHEDQIIPNEKGCGTACVGVPSRASVYRPVASSIMTHTSRVLLELLADQLSRVVPSNRKIFG